MGSPAHIPFSIFKNRHTAIARRVKMITKIAVLISRKYRQNFLSNACCFFAVARSLS